MHESTGQDTLLRLKLIREIGYFGNLDVLWQILPREASVNDLSQFSGNVKFSEGQREAFIDIYIVDDEIPETIEVQKAAISHILCTVLGFLQCTITFFGHTFT